MHNSSQYSLHLVIYPIVITITTLHGSVAHCSILFFQPMLCMQTQNRTAPFWRRFLIRSRKPSVWCKILSYAEL